jgi:hypothetical protein
MSLINEALKKAQRQRSDQPPGSSSVADRRGDGPRPMRTQSVILLVAGAAVLVVFSVVITVYLLNRNPVAAPVPSTAPTAKTPAPAVDLSAPSPVIVAPVIPTPTPVAATPVETTTVATTPPAVSALPTATPPAVEITTPAPSAAVTTPHPEPAEAAPPAVVRPTELEIQLFVDAIRVTGIKSNGGESKVLMNDRVYRVNDFVNRSLALKLVGVEPEKLTFSDASGTTYTKSF